MSACCSSASYPSQPDPPRRPVSRWRAIAGAAALAAALTACTGSTTTDQADTPAVPDPGFGHVHGRGLNPGDDLVYAATHHGVFRLTPGGPQRVADRYQDTMGFTITGPDAFLGSGHPDPRESGPPRPGLIRSGDRAQTWTPVALRGEVDFHSLSATGATVYGWDSTSGAVLRSDDDGATWVRGTSLALTGLDADPSDPACVLGASEAGLAESRDGGVTFHPFTPQPPEPLVLLDHVDGFLGAAEPTTDNGAATSAPGASDQAGSAPGAAPVAGVDAGGTVWTLAAGRWSRAGALSGPPEAFTVAGDGRFLAATAAGVHFSTDAGRSWPRIAATTS